MSVTLEIRDGDPPYCWNSPDIWVVPGNDPNGPQGQPIAGEPAFLWGRVHNTGDHSASGARVDFYWSNPATGVLRSNSTRIGSAFVDLNPGETKEVLCIIPWIPEIVNDGHECVIAEVIHPGDPLPSPWPDEFDPPTYHQIVQKNLTVLVMKKMRMMPLQVAAPIRVERVLHVATEFGGTLDKQTLKQVGLENYRPAKCDSLKVGLTLEPGCEEPGKEALDEEVKLSLKPGTARAVYLNVWPPELKPRTYVLLHVISRDKKKSWAASPTF
ncbi:MAG: hypothetical protein VCE91_19470 [Nitrospinota bacterium]